MVGMRPEVDATRGVEMSGPADPEAPRPGLDQNYDPDQDPALRPNPFGGRLDQRMNRIERRRAKIVDDVLRAKQGRNRVPTWLLVVIFVVVVAAYAILISLA
jgi:hypothetical protein